MSPSVKFLGVSALAAIATLISTAPADAQMMFRSPPYSGSPFGPVRFPFGYGAFPTYGYGTINSGVMFPSPTGGYGFASRRVTYYPRYPYSSSYGGAAAYSAGTYNYGMMARESYSLRYAQTAARYDTSTYPAGASGKGYDPAAKPIDPNQWKDAPAALRQALINPTDKAIASGEAVNELLKAIQSRDSKELKVESPFVPPELLDQVVFTGGSAADALNLIRTGTIEFPAALHTTEYDTLREAIERDLATISAQVSEGKRPDSQLFDRLGDAARRVRAKAASLLKGEAAIGDAAAVAKFLDRLDGIVKYVKAPRGTELFAPSWHTAGVSLSELSQFMARHKLGFGPVATGGEAAYAALHRGMVGYLNQIGPAKQ